MAAPTSLHHDITKARKIPKRALPIICFREVSPPSSDASNTSIIDSGGKSYGCSENAGAAGTYYDAVSRSLIVSNDNLSTQTDTLLLTFPKQPLWTNVYIQNHAKALVPLFWSRVQVQGQIHLSVGAVLSFGLAHYASSEFELIAEELLMSNSVIKTVWMILSVEYLLDNIKVGPKSFLRGPLDDSKANKTRPRLYCELSDCPAELLHPLEDCNVNSTLPFTLQICRVEDLTVEGTITGSVIHFHWVRDIFVYLSGAISASGLVVVEMVVLLAKQQVVGLLIIEVISG
ncbi:uncharacterized protein LOC127150848 [Cucumis melo]|uniref:Uncharacterized protein LOC127150848 n=1 Tax=Cucumis melo TaxID=3656 RepID=A0ABM3L629_CUCME|nr:uncharacterized protein LOC127150848 [Cucumis melo]